MRWQEEVCEWTYFDCDRNAGDFEDACSDHSSIALAEDFAILYKDMLKKASLKSNDLLRYQS